MRVGIVGLGVVGNTLKKWLQANTDTEVLCHDPDKGMREDFTGVDAIFISIPVPTLTNGTQDLRSLESIVELCNTNLDTAAPIFVRSTVLPGTCDRLSEIRPVYAMPEFLTERTADLDFYNLPVFVGGGQSQVGLLNMIFNHKKQVSGLPNKAVELAKYAHNCFGAMKVNYFNIIKDICERENLDYADVLDVMCHTGFIERSHTQVPGPDGKYGFGGKCFPKDLKAFINYAHFAVETPSLALRGADLDNELFREK
jgi:UDP-glucose 6-dehydrogenase